MVDFISVTSERGWVETPRPGPPLPAILRNLPGKPLDEFTTGPVQRDGTGDTSNLWNDAMRECAQRGNVLFAGPGRYLNLSSLYLVDNAKLNLTDETILLRGMSNAGVLGHITQESFGTPIYGVQWNGGRIRNENPSTLHGNVFSVNCIGGVFSGFFVDEWSSLGRAFECFGERNRIHDFTALSANDGGGIRIERNLYTLVENGEVECGDDPIMWLVPAQGTYAGGETAYCIYANMIVRGRNARGLTVAMQRVTEDPLPDIDGSIHDCIATNIQAWSKWGLAVYNTLSTDAIRGIEVSKSVFNCTGSDGTLGVIDIYADDAHGGIDDINVDARVIAPYGRALHVRGKSSNVHVKGYLDAPRSTQNTVDVDDSAEAYISATIKGRTDADTLQIGQSGNHTARCYIQGARFEETGESRRAVLVTAAAAVKVDDTRFFEEAGATTARAILVVDGAQNVQIGLNDYSGITLAAKVSPPTSPNSGFVMDNPTTLQISADTITYAWLSGATYIQTDGSMRQLTLPAAAYNLRFGGVQDGAGALRIRAAAGDTIRIGALTSSAGGYIESATVGATCKLVGKDADTWRATDVSGTWIAA